MKPTTTILIGAPVSGDEARFLRKLHADLEGTESLILANFFAGKRQIDFVVVTATYAAILELKNFPYPIFGQQNGFWEYLNPAGRRIRYSGENPWQQTLNQKFVLSDEMKRYGEKDRYVPSPSGQTYYREFAGFVCIYPQIHPDSRVTTGDHKVEVRSYGEVIEILRSGSKASCWSMSDWKSFAEKHLNLNPATVEEATNPRVRQAQEKIHAYKLRIETFIGTALPPLITGNADYGQELINRLLKPENFLIVGPSGSTKTFHLHHLALAMSAKGEELPVLIEAKRYRGGDFWTVLRHATAPLFRGEPKELLDAIRAGGLRPVLIIDALNECSASHLSELLRGAQAFVLQYEARIVLTSQTKLDLPGDLHSTTIQLPLPDSVHKRCIFGYHAGLTATPDVDVLCAGFTNAYDLTLAGRCHNSGMVPESRTELYDRYIRRCLSEHIALSSALLRNIAGEMAKAFSTIWSRDMFERAAEHFLVEQNASLEIIDELRHCRLIQLTEDIFSFEHELLFDYFKAESLRNEVSNAQELADQLRKPRNQQFIELLLPRFSDRSDIATILESADEVTILCRVLAGNCGSVAREVLLEQCEALMDAALKDLPNVELRIETSEGDDGKRYYLGLTVTGNKSWTGYDALLCTVIALNFEHERLQSRFLALFDRTEWALRGYAHRHAQNFRSKGDFIWGEVVRCFGGVLQYATLKLPCVSILSTARSALMYPRHYKKGLPIRARLLDRVHRSPASDFALLLLFEDLQHTGNAGEVRTILDLAQRGLDSDIYILQIHALQLIQSIRRLLERELPQETPRVREMLNSFETSDIVVNTQRLETLASYGGLEAPVSVDDALSEMRSVIAPNAVDDAAAGQLSDLSGVSPTQFLAERAYGCLGRIFEDIFQGVYCEAYFELSDEEKRDILCLAAKAGDPGFHIGWILRELLRYGGKHALPVYQHFASGVNVESFSTQEAVGAFVLGIQGCAKWSEAPPAYRKGGAPEHGAWQAVGEILFRVWRGSDIDGNVKLIDKAWARFDGPMALAAADVLCQLSHSHWQIEGLDTDIDLVAMFPKRVKPILESCIEHREALPTVFRFGGSRDRSVIRFLIGSLERIGDATTLPTLRTIVDDPEFGKEAIQAIESIEKSILAQRALRAPQ